MAAGDANAGRTIRALARAIAAIGIEAIPPKAMRQAQLLLLDTIGCGIAGASEPAARMVADVALENGSTGQCALIARRERVSALDAVLANGVAIRVLDLNDYLIGLSRAQPETNGHPSDNIPVALAIGAARNRPGADILAAIVIGYELYARLGRLMDRGGPWDGVTVSGLVAPAMAGRLMGLDEERLAQALALGLVRAATPSLVRRGDISAAKSLANALVAQAGVQAALLAERGLTGPLALLDDKRGLKDLFAQAGEALLSPAMAAGEAILSAHVKLFPCVNTAQSAVAAALMLHGKLKGDLNNVTRIDVAMADYPVIERHQTDEGRLHPRSREAADHSFPFLIAVALRDGAFGLAQFENERWRDPEITGLMGKIAMHRDLKLNTSAPGGFPCRLTAQQTRGRQTQGEILYPLGFSQGGLDANLVIEKFHAIAAPALDRGCRERIVEAVLSFHESPSSAALDAAITREGTQI